VAPDAMRYAIAALMSGDRAGRASLISTSMFVMAPAIARTNAVVE
jgi:hypothetical protein